MVKVTSHNISYATLYKNSLAMCPLYTSQAIDFLSLDALTTALAAFAAKTRLSLHNFYIARCTAHRTIMLVFLLYPKIRPRINRDAIFTHFKMQMRACHKRSSAGGPWCSTGIPNNVSASNKLIFCDCN